MGLSVLAILALVSHDPSEEPSNISALSHAGKLRNVLGSFGATVSHFFVTYTFGYAMLAVPILTISYGWLMLTNRPLGQSNRFAFYLLTAMVLASVWLAFPGSLGDREDWTWSGFIGGMLANKLHQMFGSVGAISVWILLSVVWLILVTRVSLSDAIPIVQNTLSAWWRGIREMFHRPEAGPSDDLVPEYLQEENPEKKDDLRSETTEPRKVESNQPTVKIQSAKADTAESRVKEPPSRVDLTMDTELVQDLQAVRQIEKNFTVRKFDTELKLVPASKTISEPARSEGEESADDFRDIAKSAFDEEVSHSMNARSSRKVVPPTKEPTEEVPVEPRVESTCDDPTEPSIELVPEETQEPVKKVREKRAIDLDKANQSARNKYRAPSLDLLEETHEVEKLSDADIRELDLKIEQIIETLKQFNIETRVTSTQYGGPVVAIYQLELPSGLKISKITGLEEEIALALKVKSVRMVPVASKGTIQVEIPKPRSSPVLIRSIFEDKAFKQAKQKFRLGLALGKTIDGVCHIEDLAKMPHLLIAGTTGSGKSVGVNSMITSLLYQFDPSEVKFVMIDPKKVELALYRDLKNHHLICLRNAHGELIEDVITRPENAKLMLNALVEEMEVRYEKLAHANVRNLEDYNVRWQEGKMPTDGKFDHYKLEYIIAIIDELADLMMTAPREIETSITRLAQMARAVGIHLVVATQRPSVDVLTGLIKANFPARIAYQVRSKIDSRTILDMSGAEQLLGRGDMLYLPPGQMPIRIQNAFTSTAETEQLVEYIRRMPAFPRRDFQLREEPREESGGEGDAGSYDSLFNEALDIVVKFNQGSASLLQRRLSIGYARAARIVDQLERAGVVSPPDGGKPRQILITEDQAAMYKI